MKDSTTPLAIEARGLVKRYGDKAALDGVDLDVARGAVCALLGPNGAGKTTAVRVLTTLTHADEGRAIVAGHDVAAPRPTRGRAAPAPPATTSRPPPSPCAAPSGWLPRTRRSTSCSPATRT